MDLRDLHGVWAWVVVVSNGAAGAWAVGAHWRAELRRRELWWAVTAAQLTVFVQAGLGFAMLGIEERVVDDFHVFYGVVAVLTVAVIYSYRRQVEPWRYLLYGLGGLFLMGLGLRAMTVGV